MMKCFTFMLDNVEECWVDAYVQTSWHSREIDKRTLPAVVICPGGGYAHVSDREGEPVAREYFSAGYHVFILHYSLMERASEFRPLCQLAATVVHIRENATEWQVDSEKIAVCGFSAGGHLAAFLGTLWNHERFLNVWKRTENIRPNALILGYPVILSDEFAHVDSIERSSGAKAGTKEYEWFGLAQHISKETPPTFLWHTAADSLVPVENSLAFAAGLSREKVPFELHILPEGEHGMSTCTREVGTFNPYNARWLEWSIIWLNKVFCFEK